MHMQKVVSNLWYDKEAEDAARFYVEVFNGGPGGKGRSKVGAIARYPNAGQEIHGQEAGKVMTVDFEIDGQKFIALNGGPVFKFNEAISFVVNCEDQAEIDYFWGKLSAVPASEQCGWLKDKFGLSWQIVPTVMNEMMASGDKEKVERLTKAFLKMKKFDIAALQRAFDGK
jgi:predicted 3-demethylubiquinone-9 3-methyltransferase (glyoxalase superfamily)